jgi:dienelactone hydrolase
MKLLAAAALAACLLLAMPSAARAQTSQSLPRVVDLKTPDGTVLKGTYFAAAKPGPGVLLFHQSNRTRESWKDAAQQLAAAGINTLTVDVRGFGDSGGNWKEARKQWWASDIDTAFQYLVSQPGVTRDSIGIGGAGALGVDYSVETARLHSAEVKSLVLLSGETLRPQLQFLHDSPGLPELFVVSDDDEYPPTQAAMQLLYASASSPSKKLVHYVEAEEAPWLWYEPFDIGKVPAKGGHGTDLFAGHPELSGIILHWFVTTLLKTPGHAPADAVAAAPILEELEFGGGVAHATQQLMEARQKDTQVQLWPEVAVDIIGEDYQRAGNIKMAIDIFKLNVLAYPDSADANDNLAGAFLADGQKDLARQYAEKALALLDSHTLPASSWSDTEPRRSEIRRDLQQTLKKLSTGQ